MSQVSISEFSDYLLKQGYSKHGVAAIVGNAMQESGLNTEASGDHGSAFGLFQWRLNRQNNLKAFAGGQDITDWKIQAQYLIYELKNHFPTLDKSLRSTGDYKTATTDFSSQFENPNPLYANNTAREKNAASVLQSIEKSQKDNPEFGTGSPDSVNKPVEKQNSKDTGIVADIKQGMTDFYNSVKQDAGKYILDVLFIIVGVFILWAIIQSGFIDQTKKAIL